jgi:hypothetical protein
LIGTAGRSWTKFGNMGLGGPEPHRSRGLPDRLLMPELPPMGYDADDRSREVLRRAAQDEGDLPMRTILAAAIVLSMMGSAYCQSSSGRPALGFPLGDKPSAPADPQSEEHEKAYKSAIEKLPSRQKSDDPWQGIRSNSTTQNQKTGR